uniref:Cytochrome P450 n=1 Tax=Megaselia scalaris TaxID=36166 RepID=T1GD95_MEGSC
MVEEDGFLDSDTLQNLTYLDNIVSETLRIFTPVGSGLWKYCTKPFELKGSNGKVINLKPKDLVILPTYSFHNDGEIYNEPEKFNPDRFSEENGGIKKFKDAGLFAPFGSGPRICIGMKLVYAICKAAVVELVRNFEIDVHEKTRKDNVCCPKSFMMKLDGGVHLKLKSI